MSSPRATDVQLVTGPIARTTWDDEYAEIASFVSDRVFQLQVDAQGVMRFLCRDGDNVSEVQLADVVAEARGSAALLRAQAGNEAFAGLAALVGHALQRLAAALPLRAARSSRLSGKHQLPQGL